MGRHASRTRHKRHRSGSATATLERAPKPDAVGRVLYVGEKSPVSALVDSVLNLSGYEVVAALRGDDAVAKARRETFDLILFDVAHQVSEGEEVLGRLRSLSASQTPVVTMRESDAPGTIKQEAEAGVIDRVLKPVNAADLMSTITRVISLTEEQRESRRAMLSRAAIWYGALSELTIQARAEEVDVGRSRFSRRR